jgi:hypothetical protein
MVIIYPTPCTFNCFVYLVQKRRERLITSLANTAADHDRLRLFLIVKSETPRVEQNRLGAPNHYILTYSLSGWTTASTFHKYLAWLRGNYQDQGPIRLVLDCYSVHRSAETRTFAASLGSTLHSIPPGGMDELQPLDRSVFGALKSMCHRLFQWFCDGMQGERIRIVDVVQFLGEAWDQLEIKVIQVGWWIYEDGLGPPEESDDEGHGEWNEELD